MTMLEIIPTVLLSAAKAMPVDGVTSMVLEGSKIMHHSSDLSIIGLFMQSDAVVKFVMLILLTASVWSWAIIFDKWFMIRSVKSKTKTFEKSFWSGQPLEHLFEKIKGKESHPIALVFASAMQEWQSQSARELSANNEMRVGTKERIYQAMQVASNKSIDLIEKNLGFLATVGSSATFIGLFGTVWGIMVSFQAIAISKNTTLVVVAPGIAEALLATAFGLAAAIPAGIFYNKFMSDLNRINSALDDFSNELGAIISKELDRIK